MYADCLDLTPAYPVGGRIVRLRVFSTIVGLLATFRPRDRTRLDRGAAPATPVDSPAAGRLRARPRLPSASPAPGLHRLHLAEGRDTVLYVPSGYRPGVPAPFVLSLHGAGGNAEGGLYPLRDLADEAGLILLSPSSRGRTWDVILGDYGPDVTFIDQSLNEAFGMVDVDPDRLAIAGFSDGASYALSIGLSNRDLFGHIMAFSPGFAAPAAVVGKPRIFVSHGVHDHVLPIEATSRRVVPLLKREGYDVQYVEFDGAHNVPPEIARAAVDWFLAGQDSSARTAGTFAAR
ncbi:MAG: phospholipase/carboxylesterase [Thermomicrobiales bacterium]|nr:phospholipase/carboxylesterase [Thermomicrobiales bacterium]